MIIRRELAIDVPTSFGVVTITPEGDQTSSTPAACQHAVTIRQDGETIRVLERGEVDKLIAALGRALELFPAQRDVSRQPHADTPPGVREQLAAAPKWSA